MKNTWFVYIGKHVRVTWYPIIVIRPKTSRHSLVKCQSVQVLFISLTVETVVSGFVVEDCN